MPPEKLIPGVSEADRRVLSEPVIEVILEEIDDSVAYLVTVGKRTFDRVFSTKEKAQQYVNRFLTSLPEYEGQTRILEVVIDSDEYEVVG